VERRCAPESLRESESWERTARMPQVSIKLYEAEARTILRQGTAKRPKRRAAERNRSADTLLSAVSLHRNISKTDTPESHIANYEYSVCV